MMHKLTRRQFLRISALAATGSAAAACDLAAPAPQAVQPTLVSAPATSVLAATTVSAPLAAPVRLEIAGGDGDVWSWRRQVTGAIVGECARADLSIGDAKVSITRDGERFSALAPLR